MVTFTYETVSTVTYEEKLFLKGHLIRRWFDGMALELDTAITTEAPLNRRPNKNASQPPVGHLKANISSETHLVHSHLIEANITSGADYSIYVLGGTPPVIIARGTGGQFGFGAEGFPLPAQPWVSARRVQKISGQEPNDYMLRGYEIVAAHHSSLR